MAAKIFLLTGRNLEQDQAASSRWLAVQFQFFYLYSAFYSTIISRCFKESETQSVNPEVSTVTSVKLPFHQEETLSRTRLTRRKEGQEGEERKQTNRCIILGYIICQLW